MRPRTKDNLLANIACVAVAMLFGVVAWWAWSGVHAAHETARDFLQSPRYPGTRSAGDVSSYSLYFVVIGVMASVLALGALANGGYIIRAMVVGNDDRAGASEGRREGRR
jgi:TRAP-type C4-dicarboxylate transport system permease small subunit